MSSIPPAITTAATPGQITIPAAAVRLADLVAGQVYRVTVTATYPGRAEILIGNQYLLAATPFKFQEGDVLALKLVARSPELLRFQLALPPAQAEAGQTLTALLRAMGLPDTSSHREATALLLQHGITTTPPAVTELGTLLSTLPAAALAAFMPLYKELLERNIRLERAQLLQLARLAQQAPNLPQLAGALAAPLAEEQQQRVRSGQRRRQLEAVLAAAVGADGAADAAQLEQALPEQVALLYGSPERTLLDVLNAGAGESQDNEAADAAVVLEDLANLLAEEELPPGLAEACELLDALRVLNALTPGKLNLSLPRLLDAEPTDVQLSLQTLSEQYYQKDYVLRLRINNATQGQVEFQLRTRGPGLYVNILAEDARTLEAYRAEEEPFRESLAEGTGFLLRKLELEQHSL